MIEIVTLSGHPGNPGFCCIRLVSACCGIALQLQPSWQCRRTAAQHQHGCPWPIDCEPVLQVLSREDVQLAAWGQHSRSSDEIFSHRPELPLRCLLQVGAVTISGTEAALTYLCSSRAVPDHWCPGACYAIVLCAVCHWAFHAWCSCSLAAVPRCMACVDGMRGRRGMADDPPPCRSSYSTRQALPPRARAWTACCAGALPTLSPRSAPCSVTTSWGPYWASSPTLTWWHAMRCPD